MIIARMGDVDTFSASEKEIVDYIVSNCEDFVAMTIDKLSKATFTSNGTIIRICFCMNDLQKSSKNNEYGGCFLDFFEVDLAIAEKNMIKYAHNKHIGIVREKNE